MPPTENRESGPPLNPDDSIIEWTAIVESFREGEPTKPLGEIQGVASLSPDQVLELACRDLLRSWKQGTPRRVEEYLDSLPQLESEDMVLDLIDAELCGANWLGEAPENLNLPSRFPALKSAIEQMVALLQVESAMITRGPRQATPRSIDDLPDDFAVASSGSFSAVHGVPATDTIKGEKVWLVQMAAEIAAGELPEWSRHFRQLKDLSHPRLWPVDRWLPGRSGHSIWLVCPRIHGSSLHERLSANLTDQKLLQWLIEMGGAFAFLEDCEVIAGPVQPEEIRINHHEQVVLPSWSGLQIPAEAAWTWRTTFVDLLQKIVTSHVPAAPASHDPGRPAGLSTPLSEELKSILLDCQGEPNGVYSSAEALWNELVQLNEGRPRRSAKKRR